MKATDGLTNKIAKVCGRYKTLRFTCCECHPFGRKERCIGWRKLRRSSKQLISALDDTGAQEPSAGGEA